jgi:hypothetical protein
MSDDHKPDESAEDSTKSKSKSKPKREPKPKSAPEPKPKGAASKPSIDPRTLRLLGMGLVGLIVGLLLGALLFGGDDSKEATVSASASSATTAGVVTPDQLATEAKSLGRPVYWAGAQDGSSIDLERDAKGNVSVLYIPEGSDPGGPPADYLTVVTYPYDNAYAALQQQVVTGGPLSRDLPDGGLVISQADEPNNAYVAYKGEDYQVEIYDPRPGRALKLVLDGSIVKVG